MQMSKMSRKNSIVKNPALCYTRKQFGKNVLKIRRLNYERRESLKKCTIQRVCSNNKIRMDYGFGDFGVIPGDS